MIVDMGILNKQCEIFKLCMLIVLAGVAFSQQVFFKFFVVSLCIFKVNETEKRINEIKLRKKRDELFVLSPSGYIYIYVVIEVYLQLFHCFSVYPHFYFSDREF